MNVNIIEMDIAEYSDRHVGLLEREGRRSGMKIVIIALGTTVSFIGGIITHYGSVSENGTWILCGVTLFAIGMLTAILMDD